MKLKQPNIRIIKKDKKKTKYYLNKIFELLENNREVYVYSVYSNLKQVDEISRILDCLDVLEIQKREKINNIIQVCFTKSRLGLINHFNSHPCSKKEHHYHSIILYCKWKMTNIRKILKFSNGKETR